MVVGTRTATCLPACTALKAARNATSVLPYPTSPTSNRSIGRARSMSRLTSSEARRWSGVSSYRKADSSSRCHGVSGGNANPAASWRRAYKSSSSIAIWRIAARVLCRCRCHVVVPSRCGRGPVRLELIQPAQRHVQPGPALVLYDGYLESPTLRADRDRLDPAVDSNAVLEMDHVIAGLERPRRGADRRFAVPARSPQPAGPAEDLVVGEHPQPGEHESAVQRPHRERRPVAGQELLQSLELAFVVAQDHGRRLGRDNLAQPLDVAVHRRGGRNREPYPGFGGIERDPREPGELRPPRRRFDEQRLPRRRLLTQPPRHVEMVGRLAPGALHFLSQRRLLL